MLVTGDSGLEVALMAKGVRFADPGVRVGLIELQGLIEAGYRFVEASKPGHAVGFSGEGMRCARAVAGQRLGLLVPSNGGLVSP